MGEISELLSFILKNRSFLAKKCELAYFCSILQ